MTAAGASTSEAVLARPQPLGVFPLPAGLLPVPGGPGTAEARAALIAGREPEVWPAELEYFRLALAGDVAGALAELAGDERPEALIAAFVLAPSAAAHAALREELPAGFVPVLDLAAASLDVAAGPPAPAALDGELAAMARVAQAAQALDAGDAGAAADALEAGAAAAGVASPALAAQIRGQLGMLRLDLGDPAGIELLRAAVEALGSTDLRAVRGELKLSLAIGLQGLADGRRRALVAAVQAYQDALADLDRETQRPAVARCHANLGIAYLTMPMQEAGDQLRQGIAVQELREALALADRDTDPGLWASVQLNLANALVYLPSAHADDNRRQAQAAYEEVLAARDRDRDPLGWARVAANLGNLRAHLGDGEGARALLRPARDIFRDHGDEAGVVGVGEVLRQLDGEE